jgi:predicted transglutaminase-like cysteine proteinase
MTVLSAVLAAALVVELLEDPSLERDNVIQALEEENAEWRYIYEMRAGEHPSALVTPDDPVVVSKSAEILDANADGELTWSDIYSINNWVFYNIHYSYDPHLTNPDGYGQRDYWQKPAETLDRGEGDCDDQANLALSLMLAEENVEWLYGASVLFGGGYAHIGIFADISADRLFILDPTWGWASTNNQGESLALQEYADRGDYEDVTLIMEVYWATGSEEFYTLEEFYDWF